MHGADQIEVQFHIVEPSNCLVAVEPKALQACLYVPSWPRVLDAIQVTKRIVTPIYELGVAQILEKSKIAVQISIMHSCLLIW